jgi:hypothetical protein
LSWSLLWTVVFFTAFGAFTWVSLLIAVRGIDEIRDLIARLETGGDRTDRRDGKP